MTTSNDDRVVVVGPVITDQYYLGRANRLDQTAPVPIIDVQQKHIFSGIGGGANAARCVSHLTMPVSFVSVVGNDAAGNAYLATQDPLITNYVGKSDKYQTAIKHRVFADGKLVARFDVDEKPKADVENHVVDLFNAAIGDCKPSVILISDYDHGICTPHVLKYIMKYAKQEDIHVVVDPVPHNMSFYEGATIITPNEKEAAAATGEDDVARNANMLARELSIDQVMITRGAKGMLIGYQDRELDPHAVPAVKAVAVDTCGCGDAVAGACAYGLAANMDNASIYQLAATAGAICAEAGGAGPVPMHAIHKRLVSAYGHDKKFVDHSFAQLLRISCGNIRAKFGIANGVFDIIHAGHHSLLEQARKQCDFLLVLLNDDESARRYKGRVCQPLELRAAQIGGLSCVDAITSFSTTTPQPLIAQLLPDVLFKGPELKGREKTIPGYKEVIESGGSVVTTTLEYDVHATELRQGQPTPEQEDTESPTADSGEGGTGNAKNRVSV